MVAVSDLANNVDLRRNRVCSRGHSRVRWLSDDWWEMVYDSLVERRVLEQLVRALRG